jgi:hypothetical protein
MPAQEAELRASIERSLLSSSDNTMMAALLV